MTCLDNTRLLRFIDGALSAQELALVDEHLDRCELCRLLITSMLHSRSVAQPMPAHGDPMLVPDDAARIGLVLGRRYVLGSLLGQGGMGQVFSARDRLTGQMVALKRVSWRRTGQWDNRLEALAQEWKILARLHHPYIVSVLDYGFDEQRRPYFTMELLLEALPILPFAAAAPRQLQLDLLIQLLRALRYLHRRGVLHRDIKPSNILITGMNSEPLVKLVDFGLSLGTGATSREHAAGTLPYMAPELFSGGKATVQSELYAVGVIAYQILANRYPFQFDPKPSAFIAQILHQEPDLSALPIEFRAVLGKALSKSAATRYNDATALLQDVAHAAGMTLPAEPAQVRDSHFVAAEFMGRTRELGMLCESLHAAERGSGAAWLVGGESGVGKSRLLEELRSQALLSGVLVVTGQASADGGSPYALWQTPIQLLALQTELAPEEASVLGAVIPNLSRLLGREVLPPGATEPHAIRLRMQRVLREVVERAPKPLLVLLEDLQWADAESLEVLAELCEHVATQPLLIVASFRDDETPRIPDRFPVMRLLRLTRLDRVELGRLCESILGAPGTELGLIELIERETAGNTYFIVEALRTLAEEAGDLAEVGRRGLPERILAGGIRQILEHRLARIPQSARPLLDLAAVAGRYLDLAVLQRLEPDMPMQLQLCAEYGVIEIHEQRWRFSHDKLREHVLDALEATPRRALHARIADAMAAVHAESQAHAAQIAHHYEEVQKWEQAAHYYGRAGDAALARGAPAEASATFEQARRLQAQIAAPLLDKLQVMRGLSQARLALGQLKQTDAALRDACALVGTPLPTGWPGWLSAMSRQVGQQLVHRLGAARFISTLRPQEKDAKLGRELLLALSVQETYVWLAQPELLLLCTLWGMNLEESLGLHAQRTNFRAAMAFLLSYTPLRSLGIRYLHRVSQIAGPGTRAEIDALRVRAMNLLSQGRWNLAATLADQAAECARRQKDDFSLLHCLMLLQIARSRLDDWARVLTICREMESLARRMQNPLFIALSLTGQGVSILRFGDLSRAEVLFADARASIANGAGPVVTAIVMALTAVCAWQQGVQPYAEEAAAQCLSEVERAHFLIVELHYALVCVLEVYLDSPNYQRHIPSIEKALVLLQKLARRFPFVQAHAYLFRGRHEWQQGRWRTAQALLQRSLRAAERSGSRHDQAQAHYWLGRILHEHPDWCLGGDAETHLRTAVSLFDAVNAVWDANRARAALPPTPPRASAPPPG